MQEITEADLTESTALIRWQKISVQNLQSDLAKFYGFHVQYRKKAHREWKKTEFLPLVYDTNIQTFSLTGLEQGTKYEVQIVSVRRINDKTEEGPLSNLRTFTTQGVSTGNNVIISAG